VLTVTGLPDAPDDQWFVDAGLGDGLHVPVPLQAGTYEQEPYGLRLRPSEITAGWRLDHDPRSSIIGMDFESAPASLEDFAAQHAYLSTAPDSPFVRVCSAFRRKARSVDILRSLTLTEVRADRVDSTVLQTRDDFYAALRDVFDLPLRHLSTDDRDRLWGLAVARYQAFLARAALPLAAEQSATAQGH
jgi:N-hydroxyarylamine O-acetyltransferase